MSIGPLALLVWIPVALLIFSGLPPRRAAIITVIFAWLFLPFAGIGFSGLPDYTKMSATGLGVLLGTFLFRIDWLFALRPRWFDLPMAIWCLCPIASSLSNGLGLYDGLSTSFVYFVTWGLTYLIGRVYFTRLEHLRELAIGIVEGGLVYVPLCLWELKMSPNLHRLVYGYDVLGWGEVVYGGYRPKVFANSHLELGVWMTMASLTGLWLWASGSVKAIWGYPLQKLLIPLVITTVLCKVAGAWVLLLLGVSLWFLLKWTGSRLPILVLILVPIFYIATRSMGLWSGNEAINLVRTVLNERRAESLAVRIFNEQQLSAKALQHPVFGWGGWSRARVVNEDGKDVSLTDGMWIIALGNNGLVGMVSYYTALLLPMVMLVWRYPARVWQVTTMVPACWFATMTDLYSIDGLANAFVNPIYTFALGGVTGVLGTLRKEDIYQVYCSADNVQSQLRSAARHAGHDPRDEAAIRLGVMGRSLMERGMLREAEDVWLSALQHWAGLAADHPDDLEYRKSWLDGLNDLAWSLVSLPDPKPREISRAIQLAELAVGIEPKGAAYWNTLGIAYFRGGDWKSAISALGRSMEFGAGGTSFDYFFQAMACWQQGDKEEARRWYSRALVWMEEHNPDHGDLLRFRAEATSLIDSHSLSRGGN